MRQEGHDAIHYACVEERHGHGDATVEKKPADAAVAQGRGRRAVSGRRVQQR